MLHGDYRRTSRQLQDWANDFWINKPVAPVQGLLALPAAALVDLPLMITGGALWGNGQELANKKLRTRRASTTDIADGPSRRNFGNIPEFLDDISKKRKGFDTDNNRNAIKKVRQL